MINSHDMAGLLTHSAYRGMCGVEGALAQRAETVYEAATPAMKATLPLVFRALVRAGPWELEAVTRRYAPLEEFAAEARALVDAFAEARLLVADRGAEGHAVVSIAHEALLRSWPGSGT